VFGAACKKKVPPPATAAGGSTAAATATAGTAGACGCSNSRPSRLPFSVPVFTLRWEVTGDTTSISINQGIGTVQKDGQPAGVAPTDSDPRYTLTATGSGRHRHEFGNRHRDGSATAAAADHRHRPSPRLSSAWCRTFRTRTSTTTRATSRSDARDVLTNGCGRPDRASWGTCPSAMIVLEGNCDDRGSAEYNIGLGDRRASAAKEFLQQLGCRPTG